MTTEEPPAASETAAAEMRWYTVNCAARLELRQHSLELFLSQPCRAGGDVRSFLEHCHLRRRCAQYTRMRLSGAPARMRAGGRFSTGLFTHVAGGRQGPCDMSYSHMI